MATTGADRVSADEQALLLDAAAAAIADRLCGRPTSVERAADLSPTLRREGASFVTLQRDGQLLGCIGTLEARRPLIDDVRHNAVAAAFDDPRLPALTPDDFRAMSIKVSLLSPLEPLPVSSRDELRSAVRPRVDGLLIVAGWRRGTFLPSVWEQLPDPDDFLDALWQKAGLRPGAWPRDLRVWRYTTDELTDAGPRELPA